MASFHYMNNTAPFWDFLASLERQGSNAPDSDQNGNAHPISDQHRGNAFGSSNDHEGYQPPPFDPWGWKHHFFGGGHGMAHRGPPISSGAHGPTSHHDESATSHEPTGQDSEKIGNNNGEGPSGLGSGGEAEHSCGRGRHGSCGGRRGRHGSGGRGGFGPHHTGPGHRDGPHCAPGHASESPHEGLHGHHGSRNHHGSHHHRGPGRRESWARSGPFGGPFGGPYGGFGGFGGAGFDPSALAAQFLEAFTVEHPSNKNSNNESAATTRDDGDFTPEADIFDTSSAYVVHVSLPGAKKEDVGVNWDAEKSELSIAGVIYRPGDEEFLKTLAMNGRKVGPFERKIRLGTRANPAHVDAEGITAKLEDGILRIEVRKEDEGFVEIKKVDIE